MNTQDIINLGHKARIETEAFINRHLNDEAKSWPIVCHCGPANTGYHKDSHLRKRDIRHVLLN
jgi:hypothetical protein